MNLLCQYPQIRDSGLRQSSFNGDPNVKRNGSVVSA